MTSSRSSLSMNAKDDPAFELLLAGLRWPDNIGRQSAIRKAAQRPIDWDRFAGLLARHRVAPLVLHGLASANVNVPDRLLHGAQQALFAEMAAVAQIASFSRLLRAKDIEPIILKGPAQSFRSFGRLGLRTNRDIDLLVQPAAISDARQVLLELGYRCLEPRDGINEHALERWLRDHKDMLFAPPNGNGLPVELHWRLFDNRTLMPPESRPVAVHASEHLPDGVRMLPDAFNLRYLCNHGALHAWSRLKWLADINAMLADLKPATIAEACTTPDGRRDHAVGQALVLCAGLLGRTLPESVLIWPRARWLAGLAWHGIKNSGIDELESLPFGSTIKNLSHYALHDSLAYWVEELRFDVSVRPRGLDNRSRISGWIHRHLGRARRR